MSADNALVIRTHPNGGYAVIMEFLSNNGVRNVTDRDISYPTLEAAMFAADEECRTGIVEYGIRLHSEITHPKFTALAQRPAPWINPSCPG